MNILLSFIGVAIYIVYIWTVWSNKKDKGETEFNTFKDLIHDERQEIVWTSIGALVFAFGGEGILDSICDIFEFIWGSDIQDLCISLQVNNEGLFHVIGSASLGTIAILLIKIVKKKAKRKLEEI
jgi:hypothetical protein